MNTSNHHWSHRCEGKRAHTLRSSTLGVMVLFLLFTSCIFLSSTARSQAKFIPEKTFDLQSSSASWVCTAPQDPLRSSEGTFYIFDYAGLTIRLLDRKMALVRQIGGRGSEQGRFEPPVFFALGTESRLYVLDGGNQRIQAFNGRGDFLRSVPLSYYTREVGGSIAVDERENFYVNFAKGPYLVTKYDPTGKVLLQFGEPIEQTEGKLGRNAGYLVYDNLSSKLIMSFKCAPIVKVFDSNGKQLTHINLRSQNVEEIQNSDCVVEPIGGRYWFNIYSTGVGIVDRTVWVMLSHGTKTTPVLYACDLDGNKISELPITHPGGKRVQNVITGQINQRGDCAFVIDGNKLLVSHIANKSTGGVR